MKKLLIFLALFLLASVSLSAQVVKGAGLWYFNGLPNVTPSVATGTEVAYSINNKALFKWNRTTSAWVSVVQDSSITNELQDLILSGDTLSLTLSDSIVLMGQYRNRIWEITNLSDTTSITAEIEGDVAYTSTGDTIAFRSSTAWLPFTGGGGGGTFNSFNIAGDTGSSIVTDGQTVTVAGGYGINTAESGGTVTVTADTTQLATQSDISGFGTMSSFNLAGTSGAPQTITNGNTVTIAAGTGITTTAGATDQVTIAVNPDSTAAWVSGTGTNLRIPRWTGTNSLGNSTLLQSATGQTLDANLAFRITGGTTASRPTGAAGMWYWSTTNNTMEVFSGAAWGSYLYSASANGGGTAGRIFYANTNGLAAADDLLSWDATNNWGGIGIATPVSPFTIGHTAVAGANATPITIVPSTGVRYRHITNAGTVTEHQFRTNIQADNTIDDNTKTSWAIRMASVADASGAEYAVYNWPDGATSGQFRQLWGLRTAGMVVARGAAGSVISSGDFAARFNSIASTSTEIAGIFRGATSQTANLVEFRNSSATPLSVISSAGFGGFGTSSPDRTLHSELSGSATNSVGFAQRSSHVTSGTAAAGFGVGLELEAENASGTNRVIGQEEAVYTTATNSAEVSDLVFRTMRAGTLTESLRSLGNGTLQVGTLSGTATQWLGATAGNILTTITPGYGLTLASGSVRVDTTALKAQYLPLNLTGTTTVNTNGQQLWIRDSGGYPYTFMNNNYWIAVSDVNTFLDVGSTSGTLTGNSATRMFLASAGTWEAQAASELRLDADSIVIDAALPTNTNATNVLVRDAVTQRLEEKAISSIGTWLKPELEAGNDVYITATTTNQLDIVQLQLLTLEAGDVSISSSNGNVGIDANTVVSLTAIDSVALTAPKTAVSGSLEIGDITNGNGLTLAAYNSDNILTGVTIDATGNSGLLFDDGALTISNNTFTVADTVTRTLGSGQQIYSNGFAHYSGTGFSYSSGRVTNSSGATGVYELQYSFSAESSSGTNDLIVKTQIWDGATYTALRAGQKTITIKASEIFSGSHSTVITLPDGDGVNISFQSVNGCEISDFTYTLRKI